MDSLPQQSETIEALVKHYNLFTSKACSASLHHARAPSAPSQLLKTYMGPQQGATTPMPGAQEGEFRKAIPGLKTSPDSRPETALLPNLWKHGCLRKPLADLGSCLQKETACHVSTPFDILRLSPISASNEVLVA